ncbi:Triosephosphate isomerase [hydrothermal vent metagenome]|uniref:triose-phosphate isomerase n=1 Tax=hydrothermal vent metagenome TaxID=652676 RepID=A0A3B1DCF7_9ZZZZ
MRKTIVAGNWKMNKDLNESVALISEIKNLLSEDTDVKMIVCPPYTSLETVNTLIKDTNIGLGAQNMCAADSGAFTGAISASMIKSVGCEYVILGHSERRTIFGETDELINAKIKKALENSLIPIFCIGETLEERESGEMKSVIERQVKEGLNDISADQLSQMIVAYEPVWAIGTGKTATPDQAQEVHAFIRGLLTEMYSSEFADNVTIQYGGSVKPDNAKELLSQPDIDGALVGGACLKADSFVAIAKAV